MSEYSNYLVKERVKGQIRTIEKMIEPSNSIQTESLGIPAIGLLTIDNEEITADLSQFCSYDQIDLNASLPSNALAKTHYGNVISLIDGKVTKREKKTFFNLDSQTRTKMQFDFAVSDIKIDNYDDKILTRADFFLDSLTWLFPDMSDYPLSIELFTLNDGSKVFIVNEEVESLSFEATKIQKRSFIKLEFSNRKSLEQIIEDYLIPIKRFLSLMSFDYINATKVRVGDGINISNLYSPLYIDRPRLKFSNLTLDENSASLLKNFMDDFQKYAHHVTAAFDFENNSVSNLYPLLSEVEKAYSLYKPIGLATEYQKQASELMSRNGHLFRPSVQKATKWSKRIKAYRTHLMHKGERIDYDKATIEELHSIVSSLRWVFLLLLVDQLGCDKKFKQQIKESGRFKRDCEQIQANLYHGLVSNEVEPRVAYTDVFYINKLAEIYKLSEEERELMTKDLKPWKDKINVTTDI